MIITPSACPTEVLRDQLIHMSLPFVFIFVCENLILFFNPYNGDKNGSQGDPVSVGAPCSPGTSACQAARQERGQGKNYFCV